MGKSLMVIFLGDRLGREVLSLILQLGLLLGHDDDVMTGGYGRCCM